MTSRTQQLTPCHGWQGLNIRATNPKGDSECVGCSNSRSRKSWHFKFTMDVSIQLHSAHLSPAVGCAPAGLLACPALQICDVAAGVEPWTPTLPVCVVCRGGGGGRAHAYQQACGLRLATSMHVLDQQVTVV